MGVGTRIASLAGMTLRQAVVLARQQIGAVEELEATAGMDAELLLLHTLSLPRTILYTYPGRLLNEREQAAFAAAVARRVEGEPIQYITGVQEFYGLTLAVTPAVLIPRPETELLVEAVLDRLPLTGELRVADVGTGSGAIAIVIAGRLPEARVLAVDRSPEALAVARQNAETHGVAARIEFHVGDLLGGLLPGAPLLDAVVSNPPYIPEGDRASLERQVREFEPALALFAGHDGMAIYERLLPQAWACLRPGGLLALEIGVGQREAIHSRLQGWVAVQVLEDLRGIPRTVLARRGPSNSFQ